MFRTLADPIHIKPVCAICGGASAELVMMDEIHRLRFFYRGVCAGNGDGDWISPKRAAVIVIAFSEPYTVEKIATAGLYDDAGFCRHCQKFYCATCWNLSVTGGGRCPQGHFKSLDPHWSPDD